MYVGNILEEQTVQVNDDQRIGTEERLEEFWVGLC